MPLTIEIDEPNSSEKFKGGDSVHGRVVVVNNSGKSKLLTQDLVITLIGRADSSWKEPRRNVNHARQYLTTVFDEEIYFHESIALENQESTIHNREILPGRTEYQFSYQLPLCLPESYKSERGCVTYWAEVNYIRSWKPDKVIKKEFLVAGHLDLNCTPECCQPGDFTMEKKFWFGMGKVEAKVHLPRKGFIPGETVDVSLEIMNQSPWYLKKIRVYFCQVTTYHAKTSFYNEGARLCKIKCKSVYPKQAACIEGSILVPPVPPSELGGCRLIKPQYGIMIKVLATTFGKLIKSSVLEGRVPILIGTVAVDPLSVGVPQTLTVVQALTAEEYARRRSVVGMGGGTRARTSITGGSSSSPGPSGMGGTTSNFLNICTTSGTSSSEQPPSYQVATSQTSTPIPLRSQVINVNGANRDAKRFYFLPRDDNNSSD